ncbi:hypothetical protein SD10_01755 [Spirosoma radiotolerans]|uniref:Gliding motility-associated C-terminal domain-containing protein n=1 Tax=Spirosoma radiotolerans TaxID=1379870 RepID=A0A0E3ZTE8_9BACT|nr:hypothetical protein SD10_01755 [Spirosoma radiotolerans]
MVDVEIKAQSENSSFLMGNANFRFGYDAQQLQHPVLIEQYNFSSASKTADLNYNPQTLNGSSERMTRGIVSLNVLYSGSGGGAAQVSTAWTPIAKVQFDLVNPKSTSGTTITWNDSQTFPVTGLSEVILKATGDQVNSQVAKASGVFQNLDVKPLAEVCSSLSSPETGEFMIPEGFSPDGDGINDRFVLYNLGSLKASLTVYNLSGAIIYSQDNYQNDWDGKTDRGVAPAGTYFYSIRLSDGRSFERSMTISH